MTYDSGKPALLVHSCDGCGGTLLLDPLKGWTADQLEYANSHFGVYILCKTCQDKEDKRESAATVQKGTRCTHRLYHDAFSDLVVTAVDGDRITAVPIGLGGVPEERHREILGRSGWPVWLLDKGFTFYRSELHMKGL